MISCNRWSLDHRILVCLVVLIEYLTRKFPTQALVPSTSGYGATLLITSPKNHTFVKPSLEIKLQISLSNGVEDEFQLEDYVVCFSLASLNFDLQDAGMKKLNMLLCDCERCIALSEAHHLYFDKLPYGFIQIRATLRNNLSNRSCTYCLGSRLNVHIVPMLEHELPVPLRIPRPSIPKTRNTKVDQITSTNCIDASTTSITRKLATQTDELNRSVPLPFTIGILVHRGKGSFKHAMTSWAAAGLLSLAEERLLFLQDWPFQYDCSHLDCAVASTDVDDARVRWIPPDYHVRVIGSRKQQNIGPALSVLVHAAQTIHFMFLEEDFVIDKTVTSSILKNVVENAGRLVGFQNVNVVKLRSRRNPGLPFYPYVWRGHENKLLHVETPYVSNHSALEVSHWEKNVVDILADTVWRCGQLTLTSEPYYCAFSTHAGWSNNPFLANTEFLVQLVGAVAQNDWTLRLESAINLTPYLWDDQCFIVAQSPGLFTHQDTDGRELSKQSPFEDPFGDWLIRRRNELQFG